MLAAFPKVRQQTAPQNNFLRLAATVKHQIIILLKLPATIVHCLLLVFYQSRNQEIPTAEKGTNTGFYNARGERVKQNFSISCLKAYAILGNFLFPGLYKTYPKIGVSYTHFLKRQYPKFETRRKSKWIRL